MGRSRLPPKNPDNKAVSSSILEFEHSIHLKGWRIRGNNMNQAAIHRFCKPDSSDSDRFVFLLYTKAGGLAGGLSMILTAVDTVIIYDCRKYLYDRANE